MRAAVARCALTRAGSRAGSRGRCWLWGSLRGATCASTRPSPRGTEGRRDGGTEGRRAKFPRTVDAASRDATVGDTQRSGLQRLGIQRLGMRRLVMRRLVMRRLVMRRLVMRRLGAGVRSGGG
eukprot:2099038-Rhodomonas_salina.1